MTQEVPDQPVVVMVDAFSSGALLAHQAAGRYRLIHVRSRREVPATFAASLPAGLFDEDLTYPGDAEDVLRRLAKAGPAAVISASEFGVETADEIAAALGLRGNDPALSAARRDKALMMEALAAAGVRTPRQLQGTDPGKLSAWRREQGLHRIVVKPLDSAGSEDVFTCDTDQEVKDAVEAIVGKTNLMLRENKAVLGQEYLAGDEYIINSVSRDGTHRFTDVWISRKAVVDEQRKIYDYEDLLAPGDPRLEEILPYVCDVLGALGIDNGPAHTELILTSDGPVLLETGARISGLANPPALQRCTGADQVTLTLDCHTADAPELTGRPLRYTRQESARCVNLIAHRSVPLPEQAIREALEKLPAFESVRFRKGDGALTGRTVDLNSSPGAVFLVHRDDAEIERAYRALRAMEHELL
ncbi:ATP-grasp domain-containing protein [Streptomyces sp. ISL-10]|uniref:ATP-grasp domain-containing protein n=1 Tax=Streptomyces sp. ISL-10 TaxID=2819172 RepID=UPI001BE83625|nr:ATP-grasp domain-containing protein [Streptomyces sp. ISL-10]MBT2363958.1 ATP-grasp domain-containing protein [Streptomyces sp. ISL-10]